MPTKAGIILPAEGAGGNKEAWGFSQSGSALRRSGGVVLVDPDTGDPTWVGGYPVSLEASEAFTYFTAEVRMSRIVWRVPTGMRFYPTYFSFVGATLGARAELCAARWLGVWDMVTGNGTFTDKAGDFSGAVAAGQARYWERLTARIRTTMAATADTLTVTAQRSDNTNGSPTFAFLASSPVNHCLVSASPHPPANTIAPDGLAVDWGYVGVSGCADSANPATGVADIFGENVIAGGRCAASQSVNFQFSPGTFWIDGGDFVIVHGSQPAVTAQQREFYVSGILTDKPA